jgi:dihydroxyacetone kinase
VQFLPTKHHFCRAAFPASRACNGQLYQNEKTQKTKFVKTFGNHDISNVSWFMGPIYALMIMNANEEERKESIQEVLLKVF